MLEIENLTFSYNGPTSSQVFAKFNFSAGENGIIHLIGENGRGKTTLLRLISGLALPQQGRILWNDSTLCSDQVGFLSAQNNSSFFQLKGHEAIELYAELNRNKHFKKERWWSILNEHNSFQAALRQKYALCSTGMRQLINVAICLTKQAEVYLFDEPFKGLDTNAKNILNRVLEELAQEKLVLLTSHEEPKLQDQSLSLFSLDQREDVHA